MDPSKYSKINQPLLKTVVDRHIDTFKMEQLTYEINLYKKYLKRNNKYHMTDDDIHVLATHTSYDSNHFIQKKKKWQNRFFTKLPQDYQYNIMKELKELYYRNTPTDKLIVMKYSIEKEFVANICIEDTFFKEFPNNKRYKLPYIKGKFINDECSICLLPFQERTFVSQLQCSHSFHYECIQQWFSEGKNCPVCRAKTAYGMQYCFYSTMFEYLGVKFVNILVNIMPKC